VDEVDVVIAGAGAAGCAAAAVLAPHLRRVALVDPAVQPGWRIGETLPGAAARLLVRTGAWERFAAAGHAAAPLRVSRWGTSAPEALDTMRDPDGAGWRLDRARFEQDLRITAQERGAQARFGAGLAITGWDRGQWQLRLGDGGELRAPLILDATGRQSRLLRDHGQRRMVTDRLACAWYLSAHADPDGDPTIYTESTADGWWYSARVGSGQRLVAFHSDADLPALKAVVRTGVLTAARQLPGLRAMIDDVPGGDGGRQGLCSAASMARSAAGPGWLALGDATLAFDPLSSQGLFNALATGIEAGEAVLAAVAAGDTAGSWAGYSARTGRIWQAYVRHLALVYGLERRWPDGPFWQRRQAGAAAVATTGAGTTRPAPRMRGSGATTGAAGARASMAATSPMMSASSSR
jgi:flavin-dependent dehydrogenase